MSIIHQNIGISLVTKALFVGLTAFGMASMWGAIAADVGVSLLVVANALRLLKGTPSKRQPPAGGAVTGHQGQGALAPSH
jgi:Cd2+/Zn2+-exporting ATPase